MTDSSPPAVRDWLDSFRIGSGLLVSCRWNLADPIPREGRCRLALQRWAFIFVFLFAVTGMCANTTIYVGQHFEVRDHDAPVKYVFNGNTRVARVTGSLSPNERIQRLRLRAGWNLLSLAVTALDLRGQLQEFMNGPSPVIKALYRWQPATKDYATIASGESVAAGSVLWVSAQTNVVVSVRGGYVEPTQWGAPGGETFVATPALEAQPLTVPAGVTVWRYDARSARWQAGLTGDLASVSDLPPTLAPGEAIHVHSNEPADLGMPAPEERIRYYHQDHLGSSSVMTDASGVLVEETAFYPFGLPRHEHRLRQIEEHYKFTQKERDHESGLLYFEARYLMAGQARFAVPDPKYAHPDELVKTDAAGFFSNPQKLNLYAYARNNPLNNVDPTGLDDEDLGNFLDPFKIIERLEGGGRWIPSIWDNISTMVERGRSISDSYPAMVKQYKENVCADEQRVLSASMQEYYNPKNRENCELANEVAKLSCDLAGQKPSPKAANDCQQAIIRALEHCDRQKLEAASDAVQACLKRNNAFIDEDLSRAHDDHRRQLRDALQK